MTAMLKIIKGNDTGSEIELKTHSLSLGRGKTADVVLKDPSVSRLHASIRKEGKFFIIYDENSNNGVFVNDSRVDKLKLKNNDLIDLGNTQMKFVSTDVNLEESSSILITPEQSTIDPDKSFLLDVEEMESLKKALEGELITTDTKEANKKFRKLQAMLRISNAVANIFDINALIEELMTIIFDETKATRGFIMLYDENKELVPKAVRKKNQDDEVITVSKTVINTVVNNRKALLSSDLMNDERFSTGVSIIANQIKSCMCSPLIYHNEILGIIHIDSDITANIFSQDDLELLVAIANQAAVCIKNTYLIKTLTEEENKRSKLSQYFSPGQVDMLMNNKLNISLGGKTEYVTMIFCDIRSFTTISEGMNALEVMNFLNEFFSEMTEMIFKYDGMVDNFMGDCIMAVFGGPFHHDNDPERAVRAAIDMQLRHIKLNKKFEKENRKTFGIGIGIHSGTVSRGNIGSTQMKKYTVIGSNVNISSRLCSVAKAGEILVSEATVKNLPNDFVLTKLDPVKVKNVGEPLIPYRVNYNIED
ncbi:MAG: hypothetical protein ACD_79C00352G0001 [uncultured bacterium]|nr:MAG: hypothetical protein ACD_79C00352G0001 [uncultured bacterium]